MVTFFVRELSGLESVAQAFWLLASAYQLAMGPNSAGVELGQLARTKGNNVKTNLTALLLILSNQAFAATQLNCKIWEQVGASSVNYEVNSPLSGPNQSVRLNLKARTMNLNFGVTSYLSTIISPGNNLVGVEINDTAPSGRGSYSEGNSRLTTTDVVVDGIFQIECIAK